MSAHHRRLMRLEPLPELVEGDQDSVRCPLPEDRLALAQLMLDSYRGSVDDEGEDLAGSLREVDTLFASEYGDWLPSFSGIVELNGRPAAATLVTRWRNAPFIAFSLTHPDFRRRGLARRGLLRVIHALRAADDTCLQLVVTRGNTPAERLYEALGFVEVDRPAT